MLPWVIRTLGLEHAGRKEREVYRAEEYEARSEAVKAAMKLLDELTEERNLSPDVVQAARVQHEDRLQHIVNGTSAERV